MSRQVTINDTITKDIASYDSSDYAWASQSSIANCYDGSSSTSYGQINLTTGSNATTYVYFIFDSLSDIPSTASITSVSCSCKCSINQTNSSRIATRQAQLYTGTTSKGTAYTVANSTTAFSISAGSWTRAELLNARLRIYAARGTSNTTTNYYFRFYGATLTVNYSYQGTAYTITASSTASGVTVNPASQEKMAGESAEVVLSSNQNIVITDNNTDVTSQLVARQASGTETFIPSSVVESTFTTDSSYPTTNGYHDTDNTTSYARFRLTSTTQHAIYGFDVSNIPATATIQSVACSVRAYVTSTSSSISTKTARLYAGTTAKGSAYTLPTSNSVWSFSSVGTWTRTELSNIRLRFDGAYSGSSSYYIRFYGAELSVTYQDSGYVYVYTMSNLSADHTILVVSGGGTSYTIYVKDSGTWKLAKKVFVKQSGTWEEASAVKVKDNGTWK